MTRPTGDSRTVHLPIETSYFPSFDGPVTLPLKVFTKPSAETRKTFIHAASLEYVECTIAGLCASMATTIKVVDILDFSISTFGFEE